MGKGGRTQNSFRQRRQVAAGGAVSALLQVLGHVGEPLAGGRRLGFELLLLVFRQLLQHLL